ncbi:MAG: hypothetical protein D4S01_09145 [Dehalococcoidia bacterium]|nr:MAG: hypothetical protein D4S01_09145 [Dehalococcoidia bacterium]
MKNKLWYKVEVYEEDRYGNLLISVWETGIDQGPNSIQASGTVSYSAQANSLSLDDGKPRGWMPNATDAEYCQRSSQAEYGEWYGFDYCIKGDFNIWDIETPARVLKLHNRIHRAVEKTRNQIRENGGEVGSFAQMFLAVLSRMGSRVIYKDYKFIEA